MNETKQTFIISMTVWVQGVRVQVWIIRVQVQVLVMKNMGYDFDTGPLFWRSTISKVHYADTRHTNKIRVNVA